MAVGFVLRGGAGGFRSVGLAIFLYVEGYQN